MFFYVFLFFLCFLCVLVMLDAPMDPPASDTHPYEGQALSNMPSDTGYSCKMVDGVVHVYSKENHTDK